jgi:phosphoglycolate phosphatase
LPRGRHFLKRLVLFDIDETMISSDGAGRRAITRVLLAHHDDIPEAALQINMSGKTDPQILSEILALANKAHLSTEQLMETFIEPYLKILAEEIKASAYYIVHEGILELLERLKEQEGAYLGLLTGNVETGARMKLERFDLNKYFPIGAYGSDSASRLDLPAVATKRAAEHFGQKFEPEQVVIIGDSVNDILCAQHFGAKCIAVNTGKTAWNELESLQPEHLFKTLSATEAVVTAIFS